MAANLARGPLRLGADFVAGFSAAIARPRQKVGNQGLREIF
jgi:hypothetical protein